MSDKPFDLVGYLEEDLRNRRAGGEDCPKCRGAKWVYFGEFMADGTEKVERCRECAASGKSPAITQAEAALEAARGLVEREKGLRVWAKQRLNDRDKFMSVPYAGRAVLAILNAPPVESEARTEEGD